MNHAVMNFGLEYPLNHFATLKSTANNKWMGSSSPPRAKGLLWSATNFQFWQVSLAFTHKEFLFYNFIYFSCLWYGHQSDIVSFQIADQLHRRPKWSYGAGPWLQALRLIVGSFISQATGTCQANCGQINVFVGLCMAAVSYTHLTLPTKLSV